MRGFKIGLILASVVAIGACSNDADKVFIADPGPLAYVRFVNAISDSGGQDWRFVDLLEGSPSVGNMTFRAIWPGATYQSATPGARHLRIFQSSTDISFNDPTKATPEIVSTVFIDSTFTLVAGTQYTIAAVGSLRAHTAKLLILTDEPPDPASNVGVRVVNLDVGPSLDVYGSPKGGSSALPASPLVSALAALTASPWVSLTPDTLALRANAAGSKTLPAMLDSKAPAGVAADRVLNLTAIGGSTIAGSAFTAFLFPAAVEGSPAAAVVAGKCPTKCATAGAVFAVDRYPPSGF